MKWNYILPTFLSNFSIGINAPILTLLLCQHGCSLQNISLAIAVFSGTVIVTEIPSGIFADMYGRKLSFIVSCIAGILSGVVLLLSQSFLLASVGLALMGLSAAFSSGSLDALAIEDTVRRKGNSALTKAISTLLIFQSAGLMCGALLGGFLPYIEGYALHLLLKCVLCLIAALTMLFIPGRIRKDVSIHRTSLRLHLNNMIELLRGSQTLKSITICIMFVALVQAALETYWQPQLSGIMSDGSQTVLGFLAAAAYLATTVGCVVLGRINLNSPKRSWTLYLGTNAGIAALTALLSITRDVSAFSIIYIILYLSIGMLSVSEQAMINREISDDVRRLCLVLHHLRHALALWSAE